MTGPGVREVSSQAYGSESPKSGGRRASADSHPRVALARVRGWVLLLLSLWMAPAALAESDEAQEPGEALYVSEFPSGTTSTWRSSGIRP